MNSKTLIIANWKMNPINWTNAKKLFDSVKKNLKKFENIKIVFCPPFIYLPLLSNSKSESTMNLSFGSQNCFWENEGAFTGEISVQMLKEFGVKYVIIGHSERRQFLNETDEMINKKIKAVLKSNLKPILCIGETKKQKKQNKTFKILRNQININLKSISNSNLKSKISNLIIAYEPIWAIGTGEPCNPQEAKKVFLFLKKIFPHNLILYGGSVTNENAVNYIRTGFNGLLVGGTSLDPKKFVNLIENVRKNL